jgi:hypothetical protein
MNSPTLSPIFHPQRRQEAHSCTTRGWCRRRADIDRPYRVSISAPHTCASRTSLVHAPFLIAERVFGSSANRKSGSLRSWVSLVVHGNVGGVLCDSRTSSNSSGSKSAADLSSTAWPSRHRLSARDSVDHHQRQRMMSKAWSRKSSAICNPVDILVSGLHREIAVRKTRTVYTLD